MNLSIFVSLCLCDFASLKNLYHQYSHYYRDYRCHHSWHHEGVVKNIFAEQKLQEADLEKKAMQTRLEARRLEAVALEQENKAKVEEALSRIANF